MQNAVIAEAAHGALAMGGGIADAGSLTLERTLVQGNRVSATGTTSPLPFGADSGAFGGGIWVGSFGGPDAELSRPTTAIIGEPRLSEPDVQEPGRWAVHRRPGDTHADADRCQQP